MLTSKQLFFKKRHPKNYFYHFEKAEHFYVLYIPDQNFLDVLSLKFNLEFESFAPKFRQIICNNNLLPFLLHKGYQDPCCYNALLPLAQSRIFFVLKIQYSVLDLIEINLLVIRMDEIYFIFIYIIKQVVRYLNSMEGILSTYKHCCEL